MTADINSDHDSVYLDFEFESYKLSPDEAKRIGEELVNHAESVENLEE